MTKRTSYISLQEASRHCDYSQEYLSLRARQGKLKSVKNGRNWVTTLEWLNDYIKNTEVIKSEMVKAKEAKQINKDTQRIPVNVVEKSKKIPAPQNLPVENVLVLNRKQLKVGPSSFLLLSAFLILFCGSIFCGKNSIVESFKYFNSAFQVVGQTGDYLIRENALSVAETISDAKSLAIFTSQNISDKISQASLAAATTSNDPSSNNLFYRIFNFFDKNKKTVVGESSQQLQNSGVVQIDRIEMRDQVTGDIYCTWIEDGWLVKTKTSCKDIPLKNFSNSN